MRGGLWGVWGGGYPKYRQAPDNIIYCRNFPITFNYRKYINSCIRVIVLHLYHNVLFKYHTELYSHNKQTIGCLNK